MVCAWCVRIPRVFVSLKTWKFGQNPYEWCPQEHCATNTRPCGPLQKWVILSEDHQFSNCCKKKRVGDFLREKFGRTINFWKEKIGKTFLQKVDNFGCCLRKNHKFGNTWPPKSSMGSRFQPGSPQNVVFLSFKLLWGYEGFQQPHLSQQHFGFHVA